MEKVLHRRPAADPNLYEWECDHCPCRCRLTTTVAGRDDPPAVCVRTGLFEKWERGH